MPDIKPVARREIVTLDYAPPQVFRFLAKCPGYHRFTDEGGCKFAASRVHVDMWNQDFPQWPIEDADGSLARLYTERIVVTPQPRLLSAPGEPWRHQNEAHDIQMCRPYFGFFDDMGTGKSCEIIQGIAELFARKLIDRAIVVTSARGLPQFVNEQIPLWMPASVRYRAAPFPFTTQKAARRFQYTGDDLLIAVTSPGAFQSKKQTAELVAFAKAGKCALYIDESQNFKTFSSLRFSCMDKLKPHTTHRFLFSGEPEPLGHQDLFAQFYLMDENILGHASQASFENYYCIKGGYDFKEIVDYKNMEELARLTSPHCRYVNITDCHDMPAQTWREAKFEVCQQQLDLYAQLKRDCQILIERALNEIDKEIVRRTCVNAASKFTVMAQVSNGWFYRDLIEEGEPRDVITITDERARFTIEEIVGASKKCIVYARFHEDLAQLQRVAAEMKIDAVEFSGRLTAKQCEVNKLRFQHDAKCKVFYGTTESGGESLNLQVANRTCYHSNTYNWGKRIQSERRTWRSGQPHACEYIDVIGLPIDRTIRRNNLDKEDMASQFKAATRMAKLLEEL